MKRPHLIIHGFAILHATATYVCHSFGMADELVLTMLTMIMVVLLCIEHHKSVYFIAIAIVLGNILGYALGALFSQILNPLTASGQFKDPLSTFVTTEIIGWSLIWVSKYFIPVRERTDSKNLIWIILAVAIIYAVRVMISYIFKDKEVVSSPGVFYFLSSFAALVVILFIYLMGYTIYARKKNIEEKGRANLAQYKYMTLKQQLNPHFLFNSLNILDCLINEGRNGQASEYIQKLAGVYRYMMRGEGETKTPLREEMAFVEQYIDLLKVRFGEALEVKTDLGEELMTRQILPCSIQLLIENATKHNIVSKSNPLKIDIRGSNNSIIVINNRQPKLSKPVSTGLGLKYITKQYAGISDKAVKVESDAEYYKVTLPLL